MHTIDGPWNFKLAQRAEDRAFWTSFELSTNGGPKVQCDANITLAGHSFGGATIVSLNVLGP